MRPGDAGSRKDYVFMTSQEIVKLAGLFDRTNELQLLWARADGTLSLIAAARSLGWPVHKLERVRKRAPAEARPAAVHRSPAFERRLFEDPPGFSKAVFPGGRLASGPALLVDLFLSGLLS